MNKNEKNNEQLAKRQTLVNNFLLSLVNNPIYINVPRILPVDVILLKVANSLSLKFKSLCNLNLLEAITPTSALKVIFNKIKDETKAKRSIRDNSNLSFSSALSFTNNSKLKTLKI